jgi:DNA-binding CsgD family transcriptional regulator
MIVPFALRCVSSPLLFFAMRQPIATLGRSEGCSFIVADSSISRKHAELRAVEAGLSVSDLGSLNGTFVDEAPVRSTCAVPGQVIRFGSIAFAVEGRAFVEDETDPSPKPGRSEGPASRHGQLLSDAQRHVLDLLLGPLSEKAIAKQLKLSPHTVHNHARAIFQLFGVHSRAELMAHLMMTSDATVQQTPRRRS